MALVLAPPFWPNLPPLSLISLSSFLLSQGQDVDIYDLNNLFFNLTDDALKKSWNISCNKVLEDNMFEILKDKFEKEFSSNIERLCGYERVGFSCYRSNIKTTLKLAGMLKKKRKQMKLVLGGPEITRIHFKTNSKFPQNLKDVADLIVVGAGEKPLLEFVNNEIQDDLVCFRELDRLDGYSFIPGHKKLNINSYPRAKTISLLLSRGCRKRCRFCAERLLYKKFRARSVKNIIDEIRFHRNENGIAYFVFHDSMINTDLKTLENLCTSIIENFGCIPWEAQLGIRPDMPDELLDKIKQSGCYNLFIGLESGSSRTLKRMNKGFTAGDALKFFQKLRTAGLFFGVSMIVGYPGETRADREESLRFLINNKKWIPKIEQVNPFVFYAGTQMNKKYDYRANDGQLARTNEFILRLRENKFKMTNAFLNNLVEKTA